MRYRFTGEVETTFPSICVTETIDDVVTHRTLVCRPGDIVDLDAPVSHPDLVPVKKSRTDPVVPAEKE